MSKKKSVVLEGLSAHEGIHTDGLRHSWIQNPQYYCKCFQGLGDDVGMAVPSI